MNLFGCRVQFMMLFRKAAAGELAEDSGLCLLAKQTDVDVGAVGVTGAASFFESKVSFIHLFINLIVKWTPQPNTRNIIGELSRIYR